MDQRYSNTFQFNPCRYESHLSFFGKKVLETLVKKWTSDRCRTQNQSDNSCHSSRLHPPTQINCPQSKKVLKFLCEESRPSLLPHHWPPVTCIETLNGADDGIVVEEPFEFIDNDKRSPPVPTHDELFKTVKSSCLKTDLVTSVANASTEDDIHFSTYDMINSVQNKATNMYDFYNRPNGNGEDDTRNTIVSRDHVNTSSVLAQGVNWNNMFDTELLPDAATYDKSNIIKEKENASRMSAENIFNIAFPDYVNDCGTKINNEKPKQTKTKESIQNNVKANKRKNQLKVTDVISKKVKKIKENEKSKNNFRKQKYTKTIKNWLDDVDPNNPVDNSEETLPKDTNKNVITMEIVNINKRESLVFPKTIKEKADKKVVQAQLANRDGKMKFSKPNDKIEKEISLKKIETDKAKDSIIKDKKVKSKFIAPIKSQVPVKDIDYKVVAVDGNNIQEYTENFRLIENKELLIVLVYRNGFCQLNEQHTEDSCDPEGFIINIKDGFFYFKGVHQSFKEVIERMLDNNSVICYEGKNLIIYFKSKFGLEFTNLTMIDVKIGGSLLYPDDPPDNFSDVQKLLSYAPEYTIATACVLQKTAWYTTLLDECAVTLTALLKEDGLWGVFVEIEMKLMPIIAEMERRGVTVDLQKLKSMEDILLSKMKEVEQECYKAAGKTFQLNSAVQIRTIIYDELQLDTKCNVKIKETICKGAKSTSETMLRSLVSVHPLPKLILEYRHLHKAHATFLTGIAQQVKDGVVKPTWVQTAAATGRIASNNPNLQAIPKAPFSLILFPDENNSGNQSLHIRSVYTARGGRVLLAADFRHVEVRVFAHAAADELLLAELQAAGDLFRTLAAKWLNKAVSEVSPADRERTKRMVYASLYGAGCRKLMDILGVSYEQTLSVITSFNRTFPSLKSFGRSVVARCEQNDGRLTTLCGRVRWFKNIASKDFQLKSQAERQAVNFIVQGSAADLCKRAMVLTSERLRAHRPPVDGCLLLQIHDELVWEVRHEHVDTAAGIIKEVMESCGQQCGMTMTLPVSISTGKTWGDMTEYTTHATSGSTYSGRMEMSAALSVII